MLFSGMCVYRCVYACIAYRTISSVVLWASAAKAGSMFNVGHISDKIRHRNVCSVAIHVFSS